MSGYFNLLMNRPKVSLAAVFVLMALVGLGAIRLRIDFSPEQVYVGQDDAVEFCENHKRLFRFEDSIVLVVLESTDGQSLLRSDCLQWLKQFAEQSRQLTGVRDVTSIVTLEQPRIQIRGEERIRWAPFLPEDHFDDKEYLDRRVGQLPLLNDLLISRDHQLAMTLVDLDPGDRTIGQATIRCEAIEQTLRNLPLPNGTKTFLSGVPTIRVDVIKSIQLDQLQMLPLCSALFFVVSWLMFRSLAVTMLSLFSALTTVGLAMGLIGWCGMTFSVISNVVPPLLLIIAAANNVHILSRFQVETRESKQDLRTCATTTMLEMSRTCFLTLTTTGIGFASLMIARADLLKSLGLQAAIGMACCYFALMSILPQTLVLCSTMLTRKTRRSDSDDSIGVSDDASQIPSRLQTFWKAFGKFISRRAGLIITLHLLLAASTLWICRDIAINSYMYETYDDNHPTMAAVRKMDERMSGLISLEIQLRADHSDRLFERDTITALAQIRETIPQDNRVTFYRDYVEFLSVFDHGRTLDNDSAKATAAMRRVQLILGQINDAKVTSTFLRQDQPVARIMMRIKDVGSAGMKDLINKVSTIVNREMPQDVECTITGDGYLHAVCMDAFVRDLFYSLVAASGVIFLLITILFRSLRIGLISAVPNIFPLIMTLGYLYLRGYELTAGNVIVFAISLGIAVDDTIHFLARYRDDRNNRSLEEAIQATLATSGRAIILTSVLVVSGLSILVFSDFVPTQRFAELTAVTMCAALPGDVILLPALLRLFGGAKSRQSSV